MSNLDLLERLVVGRVHGEVNGNIFGELGLRASGGYLFPLIVALHLLELQMATPHPAMCGCLGQKVPI